MQCNGELEIRLSDEELIAKCVGVEMAEGEIMAETEKVQKALAIEVAKEARSGENKFLRRRRSRSRLQRIL